MYAPGSAAESPTGAATAAKLSGSSAGEGTGAASPVERPIGNRAARDGGTLNYRRPDTRRKGLTLKYIAHNLRALSTRLAWQEILRPAQVR